MMRVRKRVDAMQRQPQCVRITMPTVLSLRMCCNALVMLQNLAPVSKGGGKLEAGPLKSAIEEQFGSLDGLKDKLSAASVAVQGSGWGWLGYDKVTERVTCTGVI
jgi:superoxide dismutase